MATMDETSIMASKETNFMLSSEEESRWINLVQATVRDNGDFNYAIVDRGMPRASIPRPTWGLQLGVCDRI